MASAKLTQMMEHFPVVVVSGARQVGKSTLLEHHLPGWDTVYPLEVKLTSRPTRADARGLAALRQHYPSQPFAPGLVLAPTERFEAITEQDYAAPWDMV